MDDDPIPDLELDDKCMLLPIDEGFFNFTSWDPNPPTFDCSRIPQHDDGNYIAPSALPNHPNSIAPSGANVLVQDYLTQPSDVPVYFHPGTTMSICDYPPPSVSSYQLDNDPGSVRAPKTRDRARHREVEQKYRNRINTKMDELCALLTPDGKPQMQKFTALDNAIKLIQKLRSDNMDLRKERADLRAHVYTLQCALNRTMGVPYDSNPAYANDQQRNWVQPGFYSQNLSPDPSSLSTSDDIPVQKTRVSVPDPSSLQSGYLPLSPSTSPPSSSPGSDSGASSGSIPRSSPTFTSQVSGPTSVGDVPTKKVVYRPVGTAPTAAIPQGRTMLACVLFSVFFFWNPFMAVTQSDESTHLHHHGDHNHGLERVFDSGVDSANSSSPFQWLSSAYIIAVLAHLLLFAWIVARLFVLPEQLLSSGSDSDTDVDTDVKQRIQYAHDHISNGHYSVAFEELSTACAVMGHPLPQTSLDVLLSFMWASFRQLGHACRIGISITVWTVQFLADKPVRPAVLHRRLTTCASIQQRIVKLASSGKIDLPVLTKLALSLSSISLQEIAYSLAPIGYSDRCWHHLLEDSYVTAGISVLQLPLPVCVFARYYLFQAASTAKMFGSVGENRRFGWLYCIGSTSIKDLVAMSLQQAPADCQSQSVFFDNGKKAFSEEPWTRMAWIRSRDLLTELLSCLTLSAPVSSSTTKASSSKSVDSIADQCLGQLEQVENCLRSGVSSTSRLSSWLALLRACQAWRRADQQELGKVVQAILKSKNKLEKSANPTYDALQFSLIAASFLPDIADRYPSIQRLLRAASHLLEKNLHEDPDDVVFQFCRLMSAEIILSCRLHLASRNDNSAENRRIDLSQAEGAMTVYLLLLDRMAPNHPRALMYRSRIALVAGENPVVAERFATAALAMTVDMYQTRASFAAPTQSSVNLLSAEAVLLLALIRMKFKTFCSNDSVRVKDLLQQAVSSFKHENSHALAHRCNELIGLE